MSVRKIELFYYPETSTRLVIDPVSFLPGDIVKCQNNINQILIPGSEIVIHVPAQSQTLDKLQKFGFHITRNTVKARKLDGTVDIEILYTHQEEKGFSLKTIIELIRQDYKDMLKQFIQREPERFEFNIDVDSVLENNSFYELRIRKRGKVPHIWFKLY